MWKRCLIAISLLILSVRPVEAENEFITDYQVNYQVNRSGLTRAAIGVKLTNRLSNIYASEFSLSIGSTNLTDITLKTPAGTLEPKIATGTQTTNITVVFPEKILGKDNFQEFTLEFTTSDFAWHLGNIWEISIPRLAKSNTLNHYNLTLNVPAAFGKPSAMTPAPLSQISSGDNFIYRFGGETLFNAGINSLENSMYYMGSSQFKAFDMSRGGCEAAAMAEIRGEYVRPKTTALLVGSYVDAHFEGTLDIFKAQNPELFKEDGSLKSDYVRAEQIINWLENDELYMLLMSGKKQVIRTGMIAGVPFKIKIDSLLDAADVKRIIERFPETAPVFGFGDGAIIDQKIMKDFADVWDAEQGCKLPFVEA